MPHSYSQQADLTCSSCNRTFTVEVWLIVDTVERLDLVERIRQGSLHTISCPHCHEQGQVDAPLLLYRPGQAPPILFSPAYATSNEQDQQQATGLIGLLREQLGNAWRDDWLAAGLPNVPHSLLPAGLSHDLEIASHRMAEQSHQASEYPKQQNPETYHQLETVAQPVQQIEPLPQILDQFIAAESWTASQQMVDQRPELLTDEADDFLGQLLELARQRRDENIVRILKEHRDLLRRCREIGVIPAFAEKLESSSPEPIKVKPEIPQELVNDFREADAADQRYQAGGDQVALDAAVVVWERILSHPAFIRAPERFQLAVLNEAGGSLMRRYRARGDVDDLDRALYLWQQAVVVTPPDHPNRPGHLTNLGTGLRVRYLQTGRLDDLEEAIRMYQRAVVATSAGHPDRPMFLSNLGTGLRDRYRRTNLQEDLEEAIQVYQQAVDITPSNHSARAVRLTYLADGLHDRYLRTGRLEDLDEAIQVSKQAVAATPAGHLDRSRFLTNLGTSLSDRYYRTGLWEDLKEAIRINQQAISAAPLDHPERPMFLTNLGASLRDRYHLTGRLEDLDEAIQMSKQAVAVITPEHPNRPGYLNNLSIGLRDRYLRTGRLEDLDEAIQVSKQAVAATPPDHPSRSSYLTNLGACVSDRYRRTGRLEDLEEALQTFQQAAATSPLNHPDRASCLNNLGNGLRDRYLRIGQLEDLEEAIRVYEQAIATTPPNHPDLSSRLNNLGASLRDHYRHTGRLEDLEEIIRVSKQAVTAIPLDHFERPMYLTNAGNGLFDRYLRMGHLEDLEEAIQVYEQAVAATPSDHPARPMYLTNLGGSLTARYRRTSRRGDLDEVIRVSQEAIATTPPSHPDRSVYLANLGSGLIDRYRQTDKLEDLEEAVRVYEQAVATIPPNHPNQSMFLNSLSIGLTHRYLRMGHLEDLEEAIRLSQQAVVATPLDHLNRPMFLNTLGNGLTQRYHRTGRLEDLGEAIRVYQQVVTALPSDHPDRPTCLNNLGASLSDHYRLTGRLEDLEETIQVYEETLSTLDRFFLFSAVTYQLGQQAHWAGLITQMVGLYLEAGHTFQALALVEGSKSRLLTTLLSRGDLPAPPVIPAHFVAKEQSTATQLAALDAVEVASQGQPATTQTETERLARLEQRRNLVDQLTSLWQEMAGYGQEVADYVALRRGDRLDWDELQQLAGHLGPQVAILSLFTLPDRVLVFVLRAGQTTPDIIDVLLPTDELLYNYQVNYEEEMLNHRDHQAAGRPLTHRWRELGKRLLAPALPHLEGASHLVISPQGLFRYLPLHAMVLNEAGETLLDRFAVSYIPALGLLARLRNRPPFETGEAFVLGYTPANPATLKGAIERNIFLGEAQAIAAQMNVQPCLDEQADSKHLDSALAGQALSLVHLSCHGGFDQTDPLRSGVWLADGLFTARQWMELHFQADLVTLSACQTALTGSLGGDELAGLSQALLFAGASSLLLGLWSVNARTTQVLMTDFYARLWDGNGHKRTDEATALREATLALRRGELLSSEEGFDLTDPYYWAPFVLIDDWR